MKSRHLQESDKGYKVFLYIFYVCAFIMASSLVYGVYVTMIEWLENGTYVMGEAIHNTVIPFENFARVSTWIFFSTIITLYEVLYNFTVLNAKITAGIIEGIVPDIDRLSVAYPDPDRPWNLVFATKIFLCAFIISAHAFYLSTKPRKSLESES